MVEFALIAPFFFLLLFAIVEGARFIFFYEMLNNAAREGARYAIVHGANSACPSGPPPPGYTNDCDVPGEHVKTAVRNASQNVAGEDLFVYDPIWTPRNAPIPRLADCPDGTCLVSTGSNARGDYVTVYLDYTYDPVIPVLPEITVSAEATLVVNN
jgi:hypothetical protein